MRLLHIEWDCGELSTFESSVNEALEKLEKEHVIHQIDFSEYSHRIHDSVPCDSEAVWGYSAYILYEYRGQVRSQLGCNYENT